MNRRDFLGASLAAGTLQASAAMSEGQSTAPGSNAREYYELRRYWLRNGSMPNEMHSYLEQASIPALNRAGVSPVGALTVQFGPESLSIFLLLRHPSIQEFAGLDAKVSADPVFQKAGESH